MRHFLDIVGLKFGRLTVIENYMESQNNKMVNKARCLCDCGEIFVTYTHNLGNGHTQSCGCLQKERVKKANSTHRLTRLPEYKAWIEMKQRCCNKMSTGYKNYGGRGIRVCDRWLNSFENFLEDMGSKPSRKHSLERIDNEKDYSPNNCIWATIKEQNKNKRNNLYLKFNGEEKILAEWADEYGIRRETLRHRIIRGWSIDEALNVPISRSNRIGFTR